VVALQKFMKQSLIKLIDVLLQRIEENPETTPSETGLRSFLGRKGYSPRDIDAAMKMVGPHVEARIREMGRQSTSVRMFSPSEEYKLSREARDALVRLEYYGLIDAFEREALLERLDHFDGEVGMGELEYLLTGIVYANVDVGSQQIIDDTMLGGSPTYH
jgi:uncharacterized protein Smg (DUF494 family)